MSLQWDEPVVGGTTLILPAIQSSNFDMPSGAGWQINADGTATFFQLSLGSAAAGSSIQLDSFGNLIMFNAAGNQVMIFVPSDNVFIQYADDGAVQGSIICAIAGKAGTDIFGNTYNQGITLGYSGIPATNPGTGQIALYVDATGNLKALTSAGNTRTIAAV